MEVLTEKFEQIQVLSQIIPETMRNGRKVSYGQVEVLLSKLREIIDFKKATLTVNMYGDDKYSNTIEFSEGKGNFSVNIYDLDFHLYKGKIYAILYKYSFFRFFLYKFGFRPEVEITYYTGPITEREINIIFGHSVYKVEITKPSIHFKYIIPVGIKRGKVKISVVTSDFRFPVIKT